MTATLCCLLSPPELLDVLLVALESLTAHPDPRRMRREGPGMDVLSDVLRVVRLSGAVFFSAEFTSPWAIESPDHQRLASMVMPGAECVVLFHILIDGACSVECLGQPATTMETGDLIVFPHSDRHTMRSAAAVAPTPITSLLTSFSPDVPARFSFGGGGEASRFLCGYLNCEQRFGPLVDALPTMLLVRSRDGYATIEAFDSRGTHPAEVPKTPGTWLGTTLKFTVQEARAARPGNAAMIGRLTELMFVEVLREYMQRLPAGQGGWLAGLNDGNVGKALRLLHGDPVRDWTVDELAREVAVSRSVLAQRFTELVGEAPMRYLANWRMQLAKQLMRDSARNIQQVAEQVGYESEAAFNRAFKRATGLPPGTWRKTAISASVLLASSLIRIWLGS